MYKIVLCNMKRICILSVCVYVYICVCVCVCVCVFFLLLLIYFFWKLSISDEIEACTLNMLGDTCFKEFIWNSVIRLFLDVQIIIC